jgi:catechol 2,3-dioxygenase-like lactoylglutathione lyase family enzyme
MIPSLNAVEGVTVFAEDMLLTKKFYQDIFAAKALFEDENSIVFRFENLMVNVLKISEAPELITPAKVADRASGSRIMFTIRVPNVDEVCKQLEQHRVKLLNGPINRPWGRRTAAFTDPAGHAWEVAQEI